MKVKSTATGTKSKEGVHFFGRERNLIKLQIKGEKK